MPLPSNTVTKEEFEALMGFVTSERNAWVSTTGYAQSGLQYIVQLQRTTPEVDLLQAFARHMQVIENTNTTSQWTQLVSSMNMHVVRRGTTQSGAETNSDRLNRWLWCKGIRVTRPYRDIASAAGWDIDWCNVRGDDSDPNSQMGEIVYNADGTQCCVGCTSQSSYKDAPAPGSTCDTDAGSGDPIGSEAP